MPHFIFSKIVKNKHLRKNLSANSRGTDSFVEFGSSNFFMLKLLTKKDFFHDKDLHF